MFGLRQSDIQGDIDLWSDIEFQFGQHMSKHVSLGSVIHIID